MMTAALGPPFSFSGERSACCAAAMIGRPAIRIAGRFLFSLYGAKR